MPATISQDKMNQVDGWVISRHRTGYVSGQDVVEFFFVNAPVRFDGASWRWDPGWRDGFESTMIPEGLESKLFPINGDLTELAKAGRLIRKVVAYEIQVRR